MLKTEIVNMLNEQINKELYSAYLYLAMSHYYSDNNLDGFAHWFLLQAQEEMDHAMRIREFLIEEGAQVHLMKIDAPTEDFDNLREPLAAALEHEKYITKSILDIYDVANKEKDYRTMQFLNWFVEEQSEEENTATSILTRYDLFADRNLYNLDRDMGSRESDLEDD